MKGGKFMKESPLINKSKAFSLEFLKVCKELRSTNCEGVSKVQIALKECYETENWIELLIDGGYYNNKEIQEKCIEIKKILISSINTAKENIK